MDIIKRGVGGGVKGGPKTGWKQGDFTDISNFSIHFQNWNWSFFIKVKIHPILVTTWVTKMSLTSNLFQSQYHVYTSVERFSLFCENLNKFQISSQNQNLQISPIVILVMKTWLMVLTERCESKRVWKKTNASFKLGF
jgi:hypothetical protein